MAEYLIQDTTLAAIGDAIRAKEGSSELIPVSEIASRIAAIQTGVTVQTATGTFTTSKGSATVNCGFKPDAVMVYWDGIDYSTEDCPFSAVFVGATSIECIAWDDGDEYCFGSFTMAQRTTGFSISNYKWYTQAWVSWTDTGKTYSYYAVKYT